MQLTASKARAEWFLVAMGLRMFSGSGCTHSCCLHKNPNKVAQFFLIMPDRDLLKESLGFLSD